jgi:hypothetical protein
MKIMLICFLRFIAYMNIQIRSFNSRRPTSNIQSILAKNNVLYVFPGEDQANDLRSAIRESRGPNDDARRGYISLRNIDAGVS